MKKSIGTSYLLLGIAAALAGCGDLSDDATQDTVQTNTQSLSEGPRLRSALAAARARHAKDGTIVLLRVPAFGPWPAVTASEIAIFDGASPEARTCEFDAIDGCELRTCRAAVEQAATANVGTITFAGRTMQATVEPTAEGLYPQTNPGLNLEDLAQSKNLWNEPGDVVRTSYVSPDGQTVRTTQPAPAVGLSVVTTLPRFLQRGQAAQVGWTGAKAGDTGAVYVAISSPDGADMPNGGKLSRSMLTCSAPPAAGAVKISSRALARLSPGQYVVNVQAESRVEDRVGIQHQLISTIENQFHEVTIQ